MKLTAWRKKIALAALAMSLGTAGMAMAQGADALLELLVRKGIITDREAKELKEQVDADLNRHIKRAPLAKASSWLDSLTLSGDLRLRYEYFDNGDQLKPNGEDDVDRNRFRYRLRLALEAKMPQWATVGLRLASGDGDPVSTNQSFTDTFRKKPITIDAAFARIQPPGWDWISVTGGKMNNPIWQPTFNSPMVYDYDVTPEGVAEQLTWTVGKDQRVRLFANLGQFVVDELSADSNDPYMMDLQGGVEARLGGDVKSPKVKLTVAGGYVFTRGLSNPLYPFGDSPNKGNAAKTETVISGGKTNKVDVFFDDYEVLAARAEAAIKLSDNPVFGTPAMLTLSAEYDLNLNDAFEDLVGSAYGATNSLDQTTGWTVQVAFGEAKKKGQWQIAYQYKYLEADAVWDAITDSDWGTGGTDRKGHVVKAAYNLQDWWQCALTVFLTEKISNRPNQGHNTVGSIGAQHNDLLRLQLDTSWKF